MNNLVCFFCLLVVIFSSCSEGKTYENAEVIKLSDFGKEIKLSGKSVDLDSILMLPFQMELKDSLLIIYNVRSEYAFQIFNINTKKYIGESVLVGNGPQEMINPSFILSNDSNIWLFDKEKSNVYQYSISTFLEKNKAKVLPIRNFKLDNRAEKLSVIGHSIFSFRFLDNLKDNRFIFFDLNGKKISSKGKFPLELDGVSYEGMNYGFISEYTTNFRDRIFMSYRLTDLIEIYDINGKLLKRIFGPDYTMPKVEEVNRENLSFGKESEGARDEYFYPVNAGKEVFVTYSGELSSKNVSFKKHIFVFDWNGKPIRRYVLDIPIYGTTVDYKNRIIYGFNDEPEYHLVQFKY
ncbi:MAG: hypothetical protein H6Q14_921 [Bacteroidetes bacterium]|nr:hypothetical protein [Bacteroidota bacterium]